MTLIDPAAVSDTLVLDARWNLSGPPGHEEYLAGHLPGAVWVDVEHDLAGPPGKGGRHPLPAAEVFIAAMRRAGVRNDRPVIVCDGGSTLGAARLWWLLRDLGHPDVWVLDGGFEAWQAAGLPVETGEVEVTPGDFSGEPGQMAQVEVADILAGDHTLVDVRTAERYAGHHEPVDPVAGHIPGALNVPAGGSLREGRFLPADELATHFELVPDDAVVYCGSGITAAQTVLALALAGRDDVALYPGSWSGWITDPNRPVVTRA